MDPFNLNRFLEAQENTYRFALREIQAGRKESHWMWYIFPQLAGLGNSCYSIYSGLPLAILPGLPKVVLSETNFEQEIDNRLHHQ